MTHANIEARAANLDAYRSARRQIHMDFHTPDDAPGFLADFSADDLARTLQAARVQGVKIFAKCSCGNSYYFTTVGRRHPQLKRDFLKEAGTALRNYGIQCYAHYAVLYNWAAGREHRDWCVIREDGTTCREEICPNSPYVREVVAPQLQELCAYPINGFFLDMVYFPSDTVCLCEHCRRAFHAETGKALTGALLRSEPHLVASFRYRSLRRMFEACRDVRDRYAPHLLILTNHAHVVSPGDFNYAGDNGHVADVGVAESQPGGAAMYRCALHYGRYFRPKNIPFEIIPVRFMFGWGEGTLKPLAQMNYENALIASQGGVINLGDQLPPNGRLDEKVYERIGQSYDFIAEREPFLRDTTAVRYAAVMQRADCVYWNRSAIGAERLFDDAHVQTDMLDATTLDGLDAYKVLMLPDRSPNPKGHDGRQDAFIFPIPGLTGKQAQRIADWVADGGRLIVSGNGFVSEAPTALAETLLGVRVGNPGAARAYSPRNDGAIPECYPDLPPTGAKGYLYGEDDSVPACYRGFPLQVLSPFYRAEPTTARALLGWRKPLLLSRTDCFAAGKMFPGEKAETAAVFINRHGRGQVLYFAFPVCLEYAETRHPWIPEVFAHLARQFLADSPVVIDGYPALQTNLREAPDGGRYLDLIYAHAEDPVIYFLHAGMAHYPSIRREYPLSNVPVFVRNVRPKAITLEPGARPLAWQQRADGAAFIVPEIRTYNIVKIVAQIGAG